jgi:hypothetical protein
MIKLSILLTFVLVSFAYAHPNHMSFENVQHDVVQTQGVVTGSDKITHADESVKHTDTVPCTEQHKEVPCKKK